MRSRLLTLLFLSVLAMSFAACSKKDQTQNAPAGDNSAAQSQSAATGPQQGGAQVTPPQSSPGQTTAPAPAQESAQATQPPEPPPPLVVPAGTHIVIRMGNSITSKTASPGDTFTGSLARAVSVGGVVAIPSGAGVTGTVVNVKSPGKFKGEGVLSIALTAINIGGAPVAIKTSAYTQVVKGKGKRTAVAVGGGTGAGALIGGIAGGGKGALIGGLIGAGAGTAGAGLTGNKELEIPVESAVTFRLAHSLKVNRPANK
jgi:hypothetical protein